MDSMNGYSFINIFKRNAMCGKQQNRRENKTSPKSLTENHSRKYIKYIKRVLVWVSVASIVTVVMSGKTFYDRAKTYGRVTSAAEEQQSSSVPGRVSNGNNRTVRMKNRTKCSIKMLCSGGGKIRRPAVILGGVGEGVITIGL